MPRWHQSPKLTPRYFLETSRLFGYPINWLFNFFIYYQISFFQVSECILASHHYPIYQNKKSHLLFFLHLLSCLLQNLDINVNLKMYSFDHLRMYNIDHINTCCSSR